MPRAVARPVDTLDGVALREMFSASTAWLESQAEAINALNVFPVPDGDTGTNMLLTMRDAMEAASQADSSASATAQALARGALLGARGNSGVILSQVLRGFGRSLQGKERVGGRDLAKAFQEATASAYKAVGQPVEGTILTVIREVAEATQGMTAGDASLASVLELACSAARGSVARTPLLLDVLRKHGVVDAGGQGLSVLLDGMAGYLRGEKPPQADGSADQAQAIPAIPAHDVPGPGMTYGFCTEFFIEGSETGVDDLRPRFEAMAQSVLVVGDQALVKVHLHTLQTDPVLAFARSLGTVTGVKIDNIDHQQQEFSAKHADSPTGEVGVVAVVAGEGLTALFRSLGAAAIVPSGQTMNPSARKILQAALSVAEEKVVILPNNRNVILTANQVQDLAPGKEVHVVPTEDLPQGIAAMMAFNYELDCEGNLSAMESARTTVKAGEVTRAVREATIDGNVVAKGQAIGLTGGSLVVAATEVEAAVELLLDHMGVQEGSVVTLYYGADVSSAASQETLERVQRRFPSAEVEAFSGGHPHYHYFLSVE